MTLPSERQAWVGWWALWARTLVKGAREREDTAQPAINSVNLGFHALVIHAYLQGPRPISSLPSAMGRPRATAGDPLVARKGVSLGLRSYLILRCNEYAVVVVDGRLGGA